MGSGESEEKKDGETGGKQVEQKKGGGLDASKSLLWEEGGRERGRDGEAELEEGGARVPSVSLGLRLGLRLT